MMEKVNSRSNVFALSAATVTMLRWFLINLAVLFGQGFVIWNLAHTDQKVAAFFAIMVFVGTIMISLKAWFYGILAIFVAKSAID